MPIVKEIYKVQVNNRFEVIKLLDEDHQPNELLKKFKGTVLTKAGELLGKVYVKE